MRFHVGAIPQNSDFQPDAEGWNALREPSPLVFQLWALPVAALNCLVLFGLWQLLVPPFPESDSRWAGIGLLIVLLTFIPVHEFLHAFAAPGWGLSDKTAIGLWPQKLVFYAHYDGALSRNRFLLVFATPFFVLSVLPIFMAAIMARLTGDGTVSLILQGLVFLNGLAACGDILAIAMIMKQVPPTALVRNQGWNTFWKLPEEERAAELED